MTAVPLHQPNAEIFVPDAQETAAALARTTHLGIGAHQDDLEILAAHGILECFSRDSRWFCGVVVTDGAGSLRHRGYGEHSDEEFKQLRRREQKKAAVVGEYGAQLLLDYPSSAVKGSGATDVTGDLEAVLSATQPETVYTHSLTDKHDTHVAVVLRVVAACRRLDAAQRPARVIGCEVWRDLDWLSDPDKFEMPVAGREHLQLALLGVFDSQIAEGKRYDLATMGRRRAHATFHDSYSADEQNGIIWGMDLTPLVNDASLDAADFAGQLIENFRREICQRIRKLG